MGMCVASVDKPLNDAIPKPVVSLDFFGNGLEILECFPCVASGCENSTTYIKGDAVVRSSGQKVL